MDISNQGAAFINKLYKDLFKSHGVERATRGNKSLTPSEKIEAYFERLEKTHADIRENERALRRLKELYYDKYVIKREDVPESYFEAQERILFEQGHGHIKLTSGQKNQLIDKIITEQKRSLDIWLNYFISSDTDVYPPWFKYFAFQGVLRLSNFNVENFSFGKRSRGTVNPFVELNIEALALVMDSIIKSFNQGNHEVEDRDLEKLLAAGSFEKLYAYFLAQLLQIKKQHANDKNGQWIKYNQKSDHMLLFRSLQGQTTGWCTAGSESTAEQQLALGDFYVYYSYNEQHQPIIPRIAIRMVGNSIAEIRGISPNQNLEPEMIDIVERKLDEFPDKEKYKQKVSDMSRLTEIYRKNQSHIELTIEEVRFLYELDHEIVGFGWEKDPRIEEILSTRSKKDKKRDFAVVYNVKESQICFTEEEALSEENVKYYDGSLHFEIYNSDMFQSKGNWNFGLINISYSSWPFTIAISGKLPRIMTGSLVLLNMTDIKNLEFPDIVQGDLALNEVENSSGKKLPHEVGGGLYMAHLENAKGLIFPKKVGGSLRAEWLCDGAGIKLPEIIGGHLDTRLQNIEGMIWPKEVGDLIILGKVKIEDLRECLNIRKWKEVWTRDDDGSFLKYNREQLTKYFSEHTATHHI